MDKKDRHRVLIIKTGYTELLDNKDNSMKVSLGDILRITPILNLYKDDEVTWVSDRYAFPLLEGNPYISRLLHLDLANAIKLLNEEFDTIVNLEKIPEICHLADKINAWRKYGFRIDKRTGEIHAYDRAFEILAVVTEPKNKKDNKKTTQELLFEMVGEKWNREDYVLGYKPKTIGNYDIGLNTLVGTKWPVKAWPKERWDELEKKLKDEGFTVTRQDSFNEEILTNLYSYMDWMNSCKLIVTCDSLGTHLSLALGKKTVGLFGPTPANEYYLYDRGTILLPEKKLPCMPCFKKNCEIGRNCMEDISVDRVYNEVIKLIK